VKELLSSASPVAFAGLVPAAPATAPVATEQAEYVDEHAIARILGVPVKTLRNWRVGGRGPPYCKFGRSVRYHVPTAHRWAAAQQRRSTSDPGPDHAAA
jgi:hypothetical protein